MKKKQPDFEKYLKERVVAIKGDIVKERFGMNNEDYALVTSQVEVIINNAASVNFNDRLDDAIRSNTLGPLNLIGIAKDCKRLEICTHVSTCYVNCNKKDGFIEEKIYEDDIHFDVEEFVKTVLAMSEKEILEK